MSSSLTVRCFAKINLQLEVLGLRSDGFHEIRTVFQSIDLHDLLQIVGAEHGIAFSCDSPELPTGVDNLVVRAAEAFFSEWGEKPRVSIRLNKRIPVAAGLGGGSSDAAATLRALNNFFGNPLSSDRMQELASDLGSDVPYFLVGGTALGQGRGEIVTPLPDRPEMNLLLISPTTKISAAKAYKLFDLTSGPVISDSTEVGSSGNLVSQDKPWHNDLESGVFNAYPEVGGLKERLLTFGAAEAVLCGSGATVVGRFADREVILRTAEALRENNLCVFPCKSLASTLYRNKFIRE